MKLYKNSINSKLYQWFYATKYLPTNLCPYFWKLVVAWFFLIPYGLISLPVIVVELFNKKSDNSTLARIGLGLVMYFLIYSLLALITSIGWIFIKYEHKGFFESLAIYGALTWVVIAVFSIIYGIRYVRTEINSKKYAVQYDSEGNYVGDKQQPPVNILAEFIKAKYNRYCPKIDWVETNKEKRG